MDRLCYTVRQIRQEGGYIKSAGSLIHCRKRNKKLAEHVGTLHSDFMVKGTWKNENSAIVRSRRESSKKGIFYIILWRADFAEFIAYKIELAWNYCNFRTAGVAQYSSL